MLVLSLQRFVTKYKCYLFIRHFSIKWICIICASCSVAAAIPGNSVTRTTCVVWCFWSVSGQGILFLLTIQLALINFLFYPTVLGACSHEPCHIRAALVNEGHGSHPFPLKELNKILSMTLRRGELIETPIASLLWWERGAEEFTRDLFQKRSPAYGLWMSLKWVLSAQPPHAWASHQLLTVKCAWKGITKRASGITIGFSHHTYYSKSTNKCEGLLPFQPSSHHYFHCRSVVCWFPSVCLNIFKENIVWSPGCQIVCVTSLRVLCSVSHFLTCCDILGCCQRTALCLLSESFLWQELAVNAVLKPFQWVLKFNHRAE